MKSIAKWMFIFCVLVLWTSRLLAYSVVQHTNSITFGSNLTAGNTAILCITYLSSDSLTAVSGNGGSYTKAASFSASTGRKLEIWYRANVSGGAEGTLTLTGTPQNGADVQFWGVLEVNGLGASPSVDVTTSGNGSSSPLTFTFSPTAADFIVAVEDDSSGSTGTLTNLTVLDTLNNRVDYDGSTTGAGSFTGSDTGFTSWGVQAVAFKTSGGGGGTTWVSNGADSGSAGDHTPYSAGTQSVQFIHDNFAANGDTITLPSGTFTWSNGTLLSKTVTIQGASYTPNTTINCSSPGAPTLATTISTPSQPSVHPYAIGINLPTGTGFHFRITGITFSGLPASAAFSSVIISAASGATDQYRVDNCLFTTTNGNVIMMQVTGNSTAGAPWGLVDHCTFIAGGGSEMIHYTGWAAGNLGGWRNDLTPGTETMNYQEDNIFQLSGYATATSQGSIAAFECFYGAQVVARYNLLNFAFFDCHGNVDVNTRWFEIYKNQFFVPTSNTGTPFFCNMRGGSGVIWGNTLATGSQINPKSNINLYTDQALPSGGAGGPSGTTLNPQIAGAAPEYGPGAGIFSASATSQGPASSPVYIWGNDANMQVTTQVGVGGWSPSPIAINSNYFVSSTQPGSMTISEKASQIPATTYSYTSYTYPHPFTNITGSLTVETDAASAIGSTTVQLNGAIDTLGPGGNATVEGFHWGPTVSYGNTVSQSGSFAVGSFNDALTGLSPSATYHFQAFATSPDGTVTGADQQFTTGAPPVIPPPYPFSLAPAQLLKH